MCWWNRHDTQHLHRLVKVPFFFHFKQKGLAQTIENHFTHKSGRGAIVLCVIIFLDSIHTFLSFIYIFYIMFTNISFLSSFLFRKKGRKERRWKENIRMGPGITSAVSRISSCCSSALFLEHFGPLGGRSVGQHSSNCREELFIFSWLLRRRKAFFEKS